jgi:serine/threonine-protein kinase HipA
MTLIFYEHMPVAELRFHVEWTLTYDATWLDRRSAFPISQTMPLQSAAHGPQLLLPWLANLLPEAHLSEIGQRLKISPQDIVGLLAHIGRDTAGALSIGTPRKAGLHLKEIADDTALERIINELPQKPFLVGDHGVSMSLAGVQEKLPVFLTDNGALSIPIDGTPSTHILKPDAPRLSGSVENEAFCLRLARACGLDTAEATIGQASTRRYLLVTRYDRFSDGEGQMRRLHQEDFCQLTSRFPSEKYQRSTTGQGVTLQDMFNTLSAMVSPAARLPLLDAVIFNVLICNSDAHAKNYSILIGAGGSSKLAPLYDLLCASVYDHVDQSLSQSIGGRTRAVELHAEQWRALAAEIGLSPAYVVKRVKELAETVERQCANVSQMFLANEADPSRIIERITYEITKRCRRIFRQL